MSDWPEAFQALLLSARISVSATALATVVALPLAFARTLPQGKKTRGFFFPAVESILLLGLVLPPTVVGYLLIYVLGSNGPLGPGFSLLFTEPGAIIAAAVVALPLVYLPAKSAFSALDPDLYDTARLFGLTGVRLFFTVSLPLAHRGIAAGITLGFARALGEFGATLMVLGMQPTKLTLPLVLWSHYETGQLPRALPSILLLTAAALVMITVFNQLTRWTK